MTPKLSARSKENYKLYETLKKLYGDTKVETPKIDPPPHYVVPGLNIELIDVIKAKARVSIDCWEFFCWASCLQYLWRYDIKGDAGGDIGKAKVYLSWLEESL